MNWSTAWPSQPLQQSRLRLSELRRTADSLPKDTQPDVADVVSKFLVVRATGHVEFTVDACIHSFALSKSHPHVAGYVESSLFSGRNPSPGKLVDHVAKLSPVWGQALQDFLLEDDERRKRELDYLVNRRNRIAHGQNESVNLRKSLDLCALAIEIGDWIVETMDPR